MNKSRIWVVIASCSLLMAGCREEMPPESTGAVEVPPTSGSFFVVDTYDPDRDAVKDLETTTALASKSGKRILIEVGGKW